jgi:hypothetical protein
MEIQPQEKKKYPFSIRESFLCGGFFFVFGILGFCFVIDDLKHGVTSGRFSKHVTLADSPKHFWFCIGIYFIGSITSVLLGLWMLIFGFKKLNDDTKSSDSKISNKEDTPDQ